MNLIILFLIIFSSIFWLGGWILTLNYDFKISRKMKSVYTLPVKMILVTSELFVWPISVYNYHQKL